MVAYAWNACSHHLMPLIFDSLPAEMRYVLPSLCTHSNLFSSAPPLLKLFLSLGRSFSSSTNSPFSISCIKTRLNITGQMEKVIITDPCSNVWNVMEFICFHPTQDLRTVLHLVLKLYVISYTSQIKVNGEPTARLQQNCYAYCPDYTQDLPIASKFDHSNAICYLRVGFPHFP